LDAVRGGGRPLKNGNLSRGVAEQAQRTGRLPFIVKSRQRTDIRLCLNNHANMTSVAILGAGSRSVTHRSWKMFLRNSANNMLTRPPCDVPQASFADNPSRFHCSPLAPARGGGELVRPNPLWRISVHRPGARFIFPTGTRWENVHGMWLPVAAR
jgi:hypothetical protein